MNWTRFSSFLAATFAWSILTAPLAFADSVTPTSQPSSSRYTVHPASHTQNVSHTDTPSRLDTSPARADDGAEAKAEWPSFNPDAETVGYSKSPESSATPSAISGNTVTVVSSLVLVLGLFAAFVWMTRKFNGNRAGQQTIPDEVLRTIGSSNIDNRTRVMLLQLGSKILVVAQSTQSTNTLCEITDPSECQAILAACAGDSKHEFMQTLKEFESRPAEFGFTGSSKTPGPTNASHQTPATHEPPQAKQRGRLFGYA